MDQNFYGDCSEEVKRTKYVKCRCGTESEDGLSFVKYYKSLQRKQKQKKSLVTTLQIATGHRSVNTFFTLQG